MSEITQPSLLITASLVALAVSLIGGVVGFLINKYLLNSKNLSAAQGGLDSQDQINSALAQERFEVLERERELVKAQLQNLHEDLANLQKELGLCR